MTLEGEVAGVRLTVHDRGIGIAREDLERIFGRFERAVPSKHYGGLGLGLYITRRVAEAHGGRIEVASRPGRELRYTAERDEHPISARDSDGGQA